MGLDRRGWRAPVVCVCVIVVCLSTGIRESGESGLGEPSPVSCLYQTLPHALPLQSLESSLNSLIFLIPSLISLLPLVSTLSAFSILQLFHLFPPHPCLFLFIVFLTFAFLFFSFSFFLFFFLMAAIPLVLWDMGSILTHTGPPSQGLNLGAWQ